MKRLCPRCRKIVQGKCPCSAHNDNRTEQGRAGQALYGTHRWVKASKRWLSDHPLCVECEKRGRVTAAEATDHIVPHRGDVELFWDVSNWQGLCVKCHGEKTGRGE